MAEMAIRQAVGPDLPAILQTLRAALGETVLLRRTPQLWEWKHEQNPFGRSIVLVASEGGRIAGVRALMRWDLDTPTGDVIRCVRAVDTATHPDFTRRGIFRALTESAVEEARALGTHLIFNTPNDKSGPGYLKMGWSEVGGLGLQVRPTFRFTTPVDHETLPEMATLAPAAQTAGEIPTIAVRAPRGLRTPRGAGYISWRFGSHPTASYGWSSDDGSNGFVLRASRRGRFNELVLSDVLGHPPGTSLSRGLRGTRAHYVAGWFSPGSPERSIAIKSGLIPVPGVKTLKLVVRPLTDLPIDPTSLDNWDVATSDFELL